MTTARRVSIGAVLLLLAGACSRTPHVPLPDPPTVVPTRLDGTLVFLGGGGDQAGEIWGLSGASQLRLRRDTDYQTVTVSPDGSRYAWVAGGRLTVAEAGDTAHAVGPDHVDAGFAPQWSPDGTSVIVRTGVATFGRVDIASGALTALASEHPYAAFSVDDGNTAIYGDAAREDWTLVTADGSTVPVVPPPFRQYTRFQSLAPDGRHAVALLRGFAELRPDDTRTLAANAIVDVVTGQVMVVPGGGTVRQGFFRPDGGAVLRVSEGIADRVLLIAPSGEVSDRVDLPAGVSDLALLGYVPATPAPESSPSPTPTPTPSPTPTVPPVGLDGTLFLLGDGLHTLGAGGELATVTTTTGTAFTRTVAVAPAGDRYAWISDAQLRVAGLDGSASPVGPSTLDGSFTPVWVGSSLLVRYDSTSYGLVDTSTGDITPLPATDTPYLAVSPDGAFAVTGAKPSGDRALVHVQGEPSPEPVVAPDGKKIVSFASLSPDGHHALVMMIDEGAAEPAPTIRPLTASAVVDLANGDVWPVPGGGTLTEGFFQPDGSVVLRVSSPGTGDQVVLLSRTGDLLDRRDLPADAASLSLLAYAPLS